MYVPGWAFTEDANEKARETYARYLELMTEIKEKGIDVDLKKNPSYAECKLSGKVVDGWSAKDHLIYADRGNLCFGGYIDIRGSKWSGAYYTD